MDDEARERLRTALSALSPAPGPLHVPDLRGPAPRERRREAAAVIAAALLAVAIVGSLLWLRVHPAGVTVPAATPAPRVTAPPSLPAGAPVYTAPPSPAATPRCHTGDVTAALRALNSGAGQRYAALVLTNVSGHQCQVYGYVGMLLLDGGRQPLPTNVVRNPGTGPQVVSLASGQSAFTVLHWSVVSGPGEPQAAPCETQPTLVEITPPDETAQLVIAWSMERVCEHGRIDAGALGPGTGPAF